MADDRPAIAHVVHRLYRAGAEVLVAALARALKDRYRFVFLCLDDLGPLGVELKAEGFTALNLGRRPGLDLRTGRRIAMACDRHGISLLHAHQYTPFFYSALSRLPPGSFSPRHWLHGVPVLFTEHGRHYPDIVSGKRHFANQFLLRKHDRITAVGQFVRQALIEQEGLPGERIDVVYNGIAVPTLAPPPEGVGVAGPGTTSVIAPSENPVSPADLRAEMRIEMGIPHEDLVILQVARFHPVKDHDTALRAFADAAARWAPQATASSKADRGQPDHPGAWLVLVGDGEQRAKAQALARDLKIHDRVRFTGVRSDIPRFLAGADIFLLSSLSEGISVTLLEAMGARLPIAATDVGGNGEVVLHGKTGLLSPRMQPVPLADHLLLLLSKPALRQNMGAAGYQRLREQFDQTRMHRRYAEIYDQMLAMVG